MSTEIIQPSIIPLRRCQRKCVPVGNAPQTASSIVRKKSESASSAGADRQPARRFGRAAAEQERVDEDEDRHRHVADRAVQRAEDGADAGGDQGAGGNEGGGGQHARPPGDGEEADGRDGEIDQDEDLDRDDVREQRPDLGVGVEEVRADADGGEDQREQLRARSPARRAMRQQSQAAIRKLAFETALSGSDQ